MLLISIPWLQAGQMLGVPTNTVVSIPGGEAQNEFDSLKSGDFDFRMRSMERGDSASIIGHTQPNEYF